MAANQTFPLSRPEAEEVEEVVTVTGLKPGGRFRVLATALVRGSPGLESVDAKVLDGVETDAKEVASVTDEEIAEV